MSGNPKTAEKTRVLLDTNIYGHIIEEGQRGLVKKIIEEKKVTVYGCKIIRDELRDTPKWKQAAGKKLRNAMLQTYDALVGKHSIQVTAAVTRLAAEYARTYKGNMSVSRLLPDFLIVAAAAIKGLDIVCSEDDRTMKSRKSIHAYRQANKENGLKTPNFIGLKKFEAMLK